MFTLVTTPQVDLSQIIGHHTKVSAYDAVPRGVVLLIELLLDVRRDVFLDVVPFQCLHSTSLHDKLLKLLSCVHSLSSAHSFERSRSNSNAKQDAPEQHSRWHQSACRQTCLHS